MQQDAALVPDGSVSLVLLAGGVGKRMGVNQLLQVSDCQFAACPNCDVLRARIIKVHCQCLRLCSGADPEAVP